MNGLMVHVHLLARKVGLIFFCKIFAKLALVAFYAVTPSQNLKMCEYVREGENGGTLKHVIS